MAVSLPICRGVCNVHCSSCCGFARRTPALPLAPPWAHRAGLGVQKQHATAAAVNLSAVSVQPSKDAPLALRTHTALASDASRCRKSTVIIPMLKSQSVPRSKQPKTASRPTSEPNACYGVCVVLHLLHACPCDSRAHGQDVEAATTRGHSPTGRATLSLTLGTVMLLPARFDTQGLLPTHACRYTRPTTAGTGAHSADTALTGKLVCTRVRSQVLPTRC